MNIQKNLIDVKRIIPMVLTFMFSFGLIHAQKPFPLMTVETINNKEVELPSHTEGKYTLLGMAYSKKSEKDLKLWYQPIFNKFIKPKLGKGGGLFGSFTYDINVYFVPMFTGVNAAATGAAKKKVLKDGDPLIQPYILFYKGKIKQFREALGFDTKDIPYFFLLDEKGNIVYTTSGSYSDKKMSDIESYIDDF